MSAHKKTIALFAFIAGVSGSLGLVACTGDDTSTVHDNPPPKDSGGGGVDTGTPVDSGGGGNDSGGGNDGGQPSDCFTNPQTHFEIINACTDAAKIDKKPTLPLLVDGAVPPLP